MPAHCPPALSAATSPFSDAEIPPIAPLGLSGVASDTLPILPATSIEAAVDAAPYTITALRAAAEGVLEDICRCAAQQFCLSESHASEAGLLHLPSRSPPALQLSPKGVSSATAARLLSPPTESLPEASAAIGVESRVAPTVAVGGQSGSDGLPPLLGDLKVVGDFMQHSAAASRAADTLDLLKEQARRRTMQAEGEHRFLTTRAVADVVASYILNDAGVRITALGAPSSLSASSIQSVLEVGLIRTVAAANNAARMESALARARGNSDAPVREMALQSSGAARTITGADEDAPPPASPSLGQHRLGTHYFGDAATNSHESPSATPCFDDLPAVVATPLGSAGVRPTAPNDGNSTALVASVKDLLPMDWVCGLRGLAERFAADYTSYVSRVILLREAEAQGGDCSLLSTTELRDAAFEGIDPVAAFSSSQLSQEEVQYVALYYVELAIGGARDRPDPRFSPSAVGEHNLFARLDPSRMVPGSPMSPASGNGDLSLGSSPPCSIFTASTAVRVRRSGLTQVVLEQSIDNMLSAIIDDTVSWMGGLYLQDTSSPSSCA